MTDFTPGHIDPAMFERVIRPTTSLPEPAEDTQLRASVAAAVDREIRSKHGIDADFVHTSGYAETIEESPEDFARAACERAGMVAVSPVTRDEAIRQIEAALPHVGPYWTPYLGSRALELFGIIRPEPTPLDRAKAEHPDIPAEIVERIAAIVKGEAK